jgi:hypothetical protein
MAEKPPPQDGAPQEPAEVAGVELGADAPTDPEDVEGHLYGEYYGSQVQGRFRSAEGRGDATPPRRGPKLGRRRGGPAQ